MTAENAPSHYKSPQL